MEIITAEDFLDKVLEGETAFLAIIGQCILTGNLNPQLAYAMNAIAEEHSLSKNYKDYINVFLKKEIVKFPELENMKHFINLISGKNPLYGLIYNLSARKLEVL